MDLKSYTHTHTLPASQPHICCSKTAISTAIRHSKQASYVKDSCDQASIGFIWYINHSKKSQQIWMKILPSDAPVNVQYLAFRCQHYICKNGAARPVQKWVYTAGPCVCGNFNSESRSGKLFTPTTTAFMQLDFKKMTQ